MKNELLKHLEPLHKLGLVNAWHDQQIKPGQNWSNSISENLEKADVILLLVSIDFINSPYCYGVELDKAMERHSAQQARVIPIILRNCLWKPMPFGMLQALPKDAKAIASWLDRDDAYTNVAESVKLLLEELSDAQPIT
jgi:hypothetical protein